MVRDAKSAGKKYTKPAPNKKVNKVVKKVAHAIPQTPEELQNVIKNVEASMTLNISIILKYMIFIPWKLIVQNTTNK